MALSNDHQFPFVCLSANAKEMDISNTIKNGMMYIQDESEYKKHFFILTNSKLVYTEVAADVEEDEGEVKAEVVIQNRQDELHFSEKWFHGRLKGGRNAANELIEKYKGFGDGTFLVRESETFVGDYTLSFWRKGRVNHCHIHSKYEWGFVKYFLVETLTFDSLYSLITYYRNNAIRGLEFHVVLNEPIPQETDYEGKPWYFGNVDRVQAESKLRMVNFDGSFLIRLSNDPSCKYILSFRANNRIKHCKIKQDGRLFIIGLNKFENLNELIGYYELNPFYHGVCLRLTGTAGWSGAEAANFSEDYESGQEYLDTNILCEPPTTCLTLYDYKARRQDELSFQANWTIKNVVKKHKDWWFGELNNKSGWFPVNYVQLVEPVPAPEPEPDSSKPLGALEKGCISITGCSIEMSRTNSGLHYFNLRISNEQGTFNIYTAGEEECKEWYEVLKETSLVANERDTKSKKLEQVNRIAKELSNVIVYCCSVNKFSMEKIVKGGRVYNEMSSFPETTAERLFLNLKFFVWYHQVQLSRVYPKGQRLDSSNYNPVQMWNAGCQMVALNYQTADKAMQLNQGRFRMNGRSGYVLRPEFMFQPDFDPGPTEAGIGIITVISARHLLRTGRGITSPFVEIEVHGSDWTGNPMSFKTKTIQDNGLNPYWNETFEFEMNMPEMSLIRFIVYDEDIFGDPNFIGQSCFPVTCLKSGFRSIQLQNGFSEDLELSTLLVKFNYKSVREEESRKLMLRDQLPILSKQILEEQDEEKARELRLESNRIQEEIIALSTRLKR